MFWYIMICILMIYPLSIVCAESVSGKKTQEVALAAACFILWIFMAMRATSVGVDTQYYSYVFTQFEDIPFERIFSAVTYATPSRTWTFDFEPGYRLANKLVSCFSGSPQAITVFNSTVIMMLLYILIHKQSPNYMLSIWLYITLGIYQTEMNVTRNAIAILTVYTFFPCISKRQFGKYMLGCLLAASFHVAALVFIPLYWVFSRYKLTLKKCILCIAITSMIGVAFPVISPVIRAIVPSGFDKYFIGSNEKLESLMVGFLNAGVFVIAYWMLEYKARYQVFVKCSVGTIMLLLNLCFFGLNLGLDHASRMAALFGPYLIVFIPQMLSLMESKIKRKNAAILITIVCGCQYVLRLLINNIGGTMPYRFFW